MLTGFQGCVASCEEELRSFEGGPRSIEASLKADEEPSPDEEVLLVGFGALSILRALRVRDR